VIQRAPNRSIFDEMKNIPTNLLLILITTSTINCTTPNAPRSLGIPKQEMSILQQIPAGQALRSQSRLYQPPRPIEEKEFNTKKLHLLIDSMYSIMQRKAGVGLAANQIGKSLQLFMIEAKPDNPRYKVLGPVPKQIFINPVIIKASSTKKNFWHACLSAVGEKRGNVATYEWLEYRCRDEKGQIQTGRLEGFAAVIFQHEFKHLMNGTYLDVAKDFLSKADLDDQISKGKVPYFELTDDSLPLLIGGYEIGETLNEYHTRIKKTFNDLK
jgi:peptide deformylase